MAKSKQTKAKAVPVKSKMIPVVEPERNVPTIPDEPIKQEAAKRKLSSFGELLSFPKELLDYVTSGKAHAEKGVGELEVERAAIREPEKFLEKTKKPWFPGTEGKSVKAEEMLNQRLKALASLSKSGTTPEQLKQAKLGIVDKYATPIVSQQELMQALQAGQAPPTPAEGKDWYDMYMKASYKPAFKERQDMQNNRGYVEVKKGDINLSKLYKNEALYDVMFHEMSHIFNQPLFRKTFTDLIDPYLPPSGTPQAIEEGRHDTRDPSLAQGEMMVRYLVPLKFIGAEFSGIVPTSQSESRKMIRALKSSSEAQDKAADFLYRYNKIYEGTGKETPQQIQEIERIYKDGIKEMIRNLPEDDKVLNDAFIYVSKAEENKGVA